MLFRIYMYMYCTYGLHTFLTWRVSTAHPYPSSRLKRYSTDEASIPYLQAVFRSVGDLSAAGFSTEDFGGEGRWIFLQLGPAQCIFRRGFSASGSLAQCIIEKLIFCWLQDSAYLLWTLKSAGCSTVHFQGDLFVAGWHSAYLCWTLFSWL